MYKNFRVGGGIVLGLSTLVLSLAAVLGSSNLKANNEIKKLNDTDKFQISSGEVFALCTDTKDIDQTSQYVFSYGSGTSRKINGKIPGKFLMAKDIADSSLSDIGLLKFENKSGSNYYIKVDNSYLYATKATTMALADNLSNANISWSISFDKNSNFYAKYETASYGTIQYNSSAPRFLNYPSGQESIKLYKLIGTDDEKVFANNVSIETNPNFKYNYKEEGSEEKNIASVINETQATSIKGSGTKDFEEGVLTYKCATSAYKPGSKFDTSGYYYNFEFKTAVDNPFVVLTFKLNKVTTSLGNGDNSMTFKFVDSNDATIGTYSYNLGTKDNQVVSLTTKDDSFELKDVKKIEMSFSKSNYNVAVQEVNYYSGGIRTTYSDFRDVCVQVWMDYSNKIEAITETGLIITAKNGFKIEDGVIVLPTEPYIKTFVNSQLDSSYFVKVTFTTEEIAKYYESSITIIPFAKYQDKYLFGSVSTTTLKKEVEKISNSILKASFISYFNL